MKKTILSFLFAIMISVSAYSQGGGIWSFDWNTGFALGQTSDFISQPSFRGFGIEGNGFVTDKLTVGGLVAWNVFYENLGNVTIIQDETKLYGYERRYLNIMPLMAKVNYYFTQNGIQPYIGMGVGTYFIESRDYMSIYYTQGKDWHFGLAPEAGVVFPFSDSNSGIHVGFKYNLAAKTRNEPSYSWFGLNLGIAYMF